MGDTASVAKAAANRTDGFDWKIGARWTPRVGCGVWVVRLFFSTTIEICIATSFDSRVPGDIHM